MKIAVIGLGYVGAVVATCLARKGHEVVGVDTDARKTDALNSGRSPIVERGLSELVAAEVRAGRLRATTDITAAGQSSEILLVCVGTPSRANGGIDLSYVERVCQQIGRALRHHHGAPVIVFRSTMLPGTTRTLAIPTLEASSGRRAGADFGVCFNPEFMREGVAIDDYHEPPKTVIGEINRASGDLVARLYGDCRAPLIRTDLETAEMIKYADNAWHALKVGFANEIGNVCKALHIDSHRVMDAFCRDTKLNVSAAYLKPGFAFGGSCLPKDLRALLHCAKAHDVSLPILESILPSNDLQIERAVRAIIDHGGRKVGMLGFGFKPGTDDLRESPMVEVAERLLGKGFDVRIYDGTVSLEKVHGANRAFLVQRIPHISRLLVPTLEEVLSHAETVVIGTAAPEFRDVPRRLGYRQTLVDLVRVSECRSVAGIYEGVSW